MREDAPERRTNPVGRKYKRPLEVIPIRSWGDYRRLLEERGLDGWAFRGQSDARWPLSSALSRYLRDFGLHRRAWREQEARIIRIFKRKAHLYLTSLPAPDDDFEWLALMAHHGAPTRLLDFTWSPYVAAFFALERATREAAIWLLHPPSVWEATREVLRREGIAESEGGTWERGTFERIYLPSTLRIVTIGEAYRMNRRLVAQSGTFATAGVLDAPLEKIVPAGSVLKVVLDSARVRSEAMRDLYLMNMTHATLFPDLDGLARSMAYELETHWAYDPRTMRPRAGFAESSGTPNEPLLDDAGPER